MTYRLEYVCMADIVGGFNRKALADLINLGYKEIDDVFDDDEVVLCLSEENTFQTTLYVAEDAGTLSRPGGNTLEDYAASTVEDFPNLGYLDYDGVPILVSEHLSDGEVAIFKLTT